MKNVRKDVNTIEVLTVPKSAALRSKSKQNSCCIKGVKISVQVNGALKIPRFTEVPLKYYVRPTVKQLTPNKQKIQGKVQKIIYLNYCSLHIQLIQLRLTSTIVKYERPKNNREIAVLNKISTLVVLLDYKYSI